jgi:anti-sigma-K factor RskA
MNNRITIDPKQIGFWRKILVATGIAAAVYFIMDLLEKREKNNIRP